MHFKRLNQYLAAGIVLIFVGTCFMPITAQKAEKSSLQVSRGNWLYVGGSGPGNYTRIQDAINASSDGDTVYVYAGFYAEFLVINRSINLKGETENETILDGNDSFLQRIVTLESDNVSVSNFTIQNGRGGGIEIYSSNNTISHNIITRNNFGIILYRYGIKDNIITGNQMMNLYNGGMEIDYGVSETVVSHNVFQDCPQGIELWNSDFDIFSYNLFENTSDITLYSGKNCTVENNTLVSSGAVVLLKSEWTLVNNNTFIDSHGIEIYGDGNDWSSQTIENNMMDGRPIYYYRATTGVTVPSNAAQVILANCTYCIINHTTFPKGGGIQLGYSTYIFISKNTIEETSDAGIRLYTSLYNNLSYNTVEKSGDGIQILGLSTNNAIYKNTIMNNSDDGISLSSISKRNWINRNIIKNNRDDGISLAGTFNLCTENYIANNTIGVHLSGAANTAIKGNDLVNNKIQAFFIVDYTTVKSNKWENNFYSPQKERIVKIIFGSVQTRFYYLIGPMHGQQKVYLFRPGMNVDWSPAQKPYDIGG
jgi:parallel beta-helix repeat protein